MKKFTPIIVDGSLDKSKFKRWTYTPYSSGTDVYSPYDGIAFGVNQTKGLVKIKHYLGSDVYTSKIYDLGSVNVSNGQEVKQGQIIGKTSNEPINLEIVDSGNLEQLISPFFTGSVSYTQKIEPKRNIEPEKKSYKKDELISLTDKKLKTPKKTYTSSKSDNNDGDSFSFLDIGLLPLHILNKGWKWLTKKKESEEETLEEEIKRIKQLLK